MSPPPLQPALPRINLLPLPATSSPWGALGRDIEPQGDALALPAPAHPSRFPLCSLISRRQLRVQFILLIKAAGPRRSRPPRGVQLSWRVAGRSWEFRGSEMGTETSSWGGGDGSVVTSPSRTPLKDSQGEEEEVVWGGSWLHAPLAPLFSELAAPCLAPPCTAPSPKGHRDPRKGRMGTGRCTQAGARGQLQGAWGETSCMGSRRRRGLGRCRWCWERLRRHPAGLPLEAKERHELFMISFNQING